MFWYLQKAEDRPRAFLYQIQAKRDSGEFDKLPDEEQKKIIKTVIMWNQAAGKKDRRR